MGKIWMPKTAGILNIVAGSICILGAILVFLAITALHYLAPSIELPEWILPTVGIVLIIRLIINTLAIAGGVFALKRKVWGLALAGSIAAILSQFFLGAAALVLVIIGKDQFK